MSYHINIKKSSEKDLSKVDKAIREKIIDRIRLLSDNPRSGHVVKLVTKNGYRVRVGDYRILYTIDDHESIVEIYSILHRKDSYK